MIQFNLLPDVKLEFVRAQRVKHTVISAALIASAVSFAVFALLFIAVHVVQRKVMSNQTADIKKYSNQLKATSDLTQILTVQNQLGALPALHAAKPATDRTFSLLKQLTPTTVSLTDVTVDYDAKSFTISGVAQTFDKVNVMADTMKYATFQATGGASTKVFSDVAVSEFSRTATATTFTLVANYDPTIYDNTQTVDFTVPSGVSTQSVSGQPGGQLFTKAQESTR